ncbi:CapA family protein [Bdellovibrio bacteriovorus]|uniref:CapA family protein n=1 Tax=Bdellovibrio bacteriovorus TaxID=959 RepID=UPI0021CF1A83|nr:CapA family protein [Bdellovibrio bacteriovorus]UXR64564.1 CapA family protein [Bdellovibrio bacteriovorus]
MRNFKSLLISGLCLGSLAVSAAPTKGAYCQDDSVVLGFVGDILVHDALYKSILPKQRFTALWEKAIPLFNKADYMVANLEGPAALGIEKSGRDVGDQGFSYDLNVYSGTKFSFNFHPQILRDLKSSGIDLISTANNHSLDRQWRGIDRTLESAKQVGIATTGTRPSYAPNEQYYHLADVRGYRLAFIACTEATNGIADTRNQVLSCYGKSQQVEGLIRQLRGRSDIDAVIVLPHWGVEYSSKPDKSQISYARRFLEAGAAAVVGSHPHVLQPWETYRTADGRQTMIVYSLGNFLAFQSGTEKKTGAVVYLRLKKDAAGRTQLVTAYYTPTYRDGYTVYPISSRGSKEALKESAKHFGTQNRFEPDQKFPGCHL